MNLKRVAAALAVLTTLAGGPAIASVQMTVSNDPIAVTKVATVLPESIGNGEMTKAGAIDVDFRNVSSIVARDVLFAVQRDGEDVDYIHATGTFAPNTSIRKEFLDQSFAPVQTVTIARVTFADGSVWVAAASGK
jgi:hypothetical protein